MIPSFSRKLTTQQVDTVELKLQQSTMVLPLTGWVYWQRDPRRSPNCWTKVFAVLDNAVLWLFQREESAPRSLLVQVAVASVEEGDGRLLHVVDPTGEQLCLSLYDAAVFECWKSRLNEAADLTNAFLHTNGLDVQDLPSWSSYRGALEGYNRDSKRTRCPDAIAQMARRWRRQPGDTGC